MSDSTDTGVRLAHLSDTHLGLQMYPARAASGHNQREQDVARAFRAAVDGVVAWDPPLVIHSGDLAERPSVGTNVLLFARSQIRRLAGLRPDGTRRQVVVIAGNHDQPRSRVEACYLELFADLPGVHVVTGDAQQIRFGGDADRCLADVTVHAVPHEALRSTDFDLVRPGGDGIDILTAHGVAEGSRLYARMIGREFPVPAEVLLRDWSYVALGHWHTQGPVDLTGRFAAVRQSDAVHGARVWYAGSTENCDFSDLVDGQSTRGWLQVVAHRHQAPQVTPVPVPTRAMFRLPAVDAESLAPQQIRDALVERLAGVDVAGAIVGQVVTGVSRDVWSLVDVASVRAHAADALHYQVNVRYTSPAGEGAQPGAGPLGSVAAELDAAASALPDSEQAERALTLARSLLGDALDSPSPTGTASAPTGDPSPTGTAAA